MTQEGRLTPEIVAEYLVDNPDFLLEHPKVLTQLQLPHESGNAVSLIERQVRTLRTQSDSYRRQLESLVAVAREYDGLAKRLHRLTLALIETQTFDEVLNTLQDELREQFTICIVTHSMQQAARVSQRTAYFHLGDLIEVGETDQIFTNPRHELTEDYITGRFG